MAALHHVSPPKCGRQQRQLAFISEFPLTVRYTLGSANVVADALSRPPLSSPPAAAIAVAVASSPPPFSSLQLAHQQRLCPDTQQPLTSPSLSISSHSVAAFLFLVTFPLVFFGHSFLSHCDTRCSNTSMTWCIRVRGPHAISFLPDMCGHILPEMSMPGATPV